MGGDGWPRGRVSQGEKEDQEWAVMNNGKGDERLLGRVR